MGRFIPAGLGALTILGLTLQGACSHVASSARDWAFIQSVGGISIGMPARDGAGQVVLPISCDVSGASAVTVKPSTVNSGLVCEATRVQIEGPSVYVAVRTSVPTERQPSPLCPDAELGRLAPGVYTVYYGAPPDMEHPLGTIEVRAP